MSNLNLINPKEYSGNFSGMFSDKWALVTAEHDGKINTMTIGWGEIGTLFGISVATIYIRPSRHTYSILEKSDSFSISFFPDKLKKELAYCGSVSGRDTDKIADCHFTVEHHEGVPYFKEASETIICKKMYIGDLDPKNITQEYKDMVLKRFFPDGDFHRFYIGEIKSVIKNDK